MNSSKEIPSGLQKAFSIFVSELDKHSIFIDNILAQLQAIGASEDLEPISKSRAAQLEKRFHKIKGGAGFLGLAEISQHADRCESIFKTAVDSKVDLQLLSVELKSFLDSVGKLGQ